MRKTIDLSDQSLSAVAKTQADNRNITSGDTIPTKFYCDQPYIVKTNDNHWLCVTTTGAGHEGNGGQHIISLRSPDCGKSWVDTTDVESPDGVEASYAVTLKNNFGRIYCFYNHNTDNVRAVKADNPPYPDGLCSRVDSLGYFVFKYSDNNGKSWSDKRYAIPCREFEIDRNNADGGKIRYFWNVGKPFVYCGDAFVSLHKVGGFGSGFFTSTEGVLLKSSNIMTETDPEKITWETLPDGDIGLRAPMGGGKISEEQSYVTLSDGTFYANYRTVDGFSAECYSRDGGHIWDAPQYKTYKTGRRMKHPRAANFVWKCENGKYLYWFHNHGGKCYEDRNPVWISGGVEVDTPQGKRIAWSEPDIFMYDDDTFIRMSYPDLIEEYGVYYITETQKNMARTHTFDGTLFEKLWKNAAGEKIEKAIPSLSGKSGKYTMCELEDFLTLGMDVPGYGTKDMRSGFAFEFEYAHICAGDVLFDTTDETEKGIKITVIKDNRIQFYMSDGRTKNIWDSDPSALKAESGRVAIVVDGGPKIITFVCNGIVCDGGDFRQFGFGRFNPNMRNADGANQVIVSSKVTSFNIYNERTDIIDFTGA